MVKVLIYMNCAGEQIYSMFQTHIKTKDISINYIANYVNLESPTINSLHKEQITNCDYFIYQPMNKEYTSQYDIKKVKLLLKESCKLISVPYYRFRGFWFECNYIPFYKNELYDFHREHGLHNSFKGLTDFSREKIKQRMDSIVIDDKKVLNYFNSCLIKLKELELNSDIKVYDYFYNNYKQTQLFYDCFHPTNKLFYQIFKQIVIQIDTNIVLNDEDNEFCNLIKASDIWSVPIIPVYQKLFELNYGNYCYKYNVDVYDNYQLRLKFN